MTGRLSVLNVGAGDIEIKFNPHQPEEVTRAVKMLTEMQQRGYAILVRQDDGSYVRAVSIDAARGLYIISGEPAPEAAGLEDVEDGPPLKRPRGRPRRTQPIATSEAVSLGRSAGG